MFPYQRHYDIVITFFVGEGTVEAAFDLFSVPFLNCVAAGAGRVFIQRAVTEQAVKLIKSIVTGIVFTVFIGKEAGGFRV